MSITRQARTLYSDFAEYKELDRAPLTSIHNGTLVVFDSTALASLYQHPTHISDEILSVFSQLRGNAFLPHQSLKEFWATLDGASPVPLIAYALPWPLSRRLSPMRMTPRGAPCARWPTSWTTPSPRS